jgi:hypothetical protein
VPSRFDTQASPSLAWLRAGQGAWHTFKSVDFRPPVSDYQLCLLQCKGEAQMILKVTVLKGGVDVFTAHIDVGQPSELSKGVKAALDEFHRVSPKTPLLDGDIQIKLDKA